jgi:uncharacterized protein
MIKLSDNWREVKPSGALRELAKVFLAKHPIRAADSLRLAAAMIWCRSKPARRTFLCSDTRLCDAASAEGFTVLKP